MKEKNLMEALKICANHHSTKLTLNYLMDSNVSSAVPLVIHECCAAVVNELKAADFSLSMSKGGLHVADYCKK